MVKDKKEENKYTSDAKKFDSDRTKTEKMMAEISRASKWIKNCEATMAGDILSLEVLSKRSSDENVVETASQDLKHIEDYFESRGWMKDGEFTDTAPEHVKGAMEAIIKKVQK